MTRRQVIERGTQSDEETSDEETSDEETGHRRDTQSDDVTSQTETNTERQRDRVTRRHVTGRYYRKSGPL